jgi:hypothetical protein
MKRDSFSVMDKILLAAVECSDSDVKKSFTAESLLVAAWKSDKWAFGLRGYEEVHLDANRLYTKIDGSSGLVAKGLLKAEGDRILRITEAGLAQGSSLKTAVSEGEIDSALQFKVDRALQESLTRLINSQEFRDWLEDKTRVMRFRDAGSFWGIAPGTPAKTVRERIMHLEKTLAAARKRMDEMSTDRIVEQRGRSLIDRQDIERLLEFHNELKKRFRKELRVLDPEGDYGQL